MDGGEKIEAMQSWLSKQLVMTRDVAAEAIRLPSLDISQLCAPLPTRVIDVGSAADTNIRLIETKTHLSGTAPYIALSYRWGEGNKLTTTLNTLEEHLKGFLFEDMPRTLQDAVVVTRYLGVNYLWIDALEVYCRDALISTNV